MEKEQKEKVELALKNIDTVVESSSLTRMQHIQLINDIKFIKELLIISNKED